MASFPTDFAQRPIPLRSDLGQEGNAAADFLAGKGFTVLAGFTPMLAEAVAQMAKQPHICEFCPRDEGNERFASIETSKHWLKSGHAMFILAKDLDKSDWRPVGYGWTGPKRNSEVPGGETTFALRIGQEALGQKLAVPFSQIILSASAKMYGARHIWLETWASNGGATHTYGRLGFEQVGQKPGKRQTQRGETVEDTRLYMLLPDDLLPDARDS